MTKYSGKQVIKAGETFLKDKINDSEFDQAMDVLSYWRFSHEIPLEQALKVLQETTLKIDKNAIFAKRLKRYVSIVNKLRRFRQMKLKNMQDIGGCRAIVSSPKKLQKIVRALRKRSEFKNSQGKVRFKDYIQHPKEDGYRGYHLVCQCLDENGELKDIEVQLRTNLQHDWATALEIVDLFTGQALKSNQGDIEWKNFFSRVSEQFALMEEVHLFNTLSDKIKFLEYANKLDQSQGAFESCMETQSFTRKLAVVNKFEAFAQSLKIVDGKIEENSFDGYVLVEVDTEKATVKTNFFKPEDNKDAEKMYIEAEKSAAGNQNIVVALVSTTAVGGIKEAYPNYFADSTEFLKHLLFITNIPSQKNKGLFSLLFGTT
jgi:ppGpp synthetase/RelA/SpoT-type nucleotidyltranferase